MIDQLARAASLLGLGLSRTPPGAPGPQGPRGKPGKPSPPAPAQNASQFLQLGWNSQGAGVAASDTVALPQTGAPLADNDLLFSAFPGYWFPDGVNVRRVALAWAPPVVIVPGNAWQLIGLELFLGTLVTVTEYDDIQLQAAASTGLVTAPIHAALHPGVWQFHLGDTVGGAGPPMTAVPSLQCLIEVSP